MTSRDFAYWLQGFFELSGNSLKSLNEEQLRMLKNHLNLVFIHEIDDLYVSKPGDKEKLQEVHDGVVGPNLSNGSPTWPKPHKPYFHEPNQFDGSVLKC